MNGFRPTGALKNWHIIAVLVLAVLGIISVIHFLLKSIIWLCDHVKIV